jgi:hypothetical protein
LKVGSGGNVGKEEK